MINSVQDGAVAAIAAMLDAIWLQALLIVAVTIFLLFLRRAFEPKFTRKVLLNKSEIRVFDMLQRAKPEGHHVSCQVSYGEFLKCDGNRKHRTINAKRADFVLCDKAFNVVAVIEYQGSGHFGSSVKSRLNALERDRAKRKAFAEAAVPLIEVPAKFSQELIDRLLAPISAPVSVAPDRSQVKFDRIEPTIRASIRKRFRLR